MPIADVPVYGCSNQVAQEIEQAAISRVRDHLARNDDTRVFTETWPPYITGIDGFAGL